ncbi:MAG: 3-hydroxyacyl-CoA dehydrogenase NAD-binding domain-containing protein [Promethearchaeota archaeon]|jgi:enoyl-CoA hydratase/3-hydroxyacyl-CoA dehydrogenase
MEIENVKNIAVIGGGTLGSGIAEVSLLAGYEKVTIIDLTVEILEKSKNIIQQRLESYQSEDKFKKFLKDTNNTSEILLNLDFTKKQEDFKSVGIIAEKIDTATIMSRLRTETDLSKGVSDANFVIEAVSERLELKQYIFKKLGEYTPAHIVLASNTSTMSITKIGEFSKKQDKIIGMHFHTFYPLMGILIEITPGAKSTDESLKLGQSIAQKFPCLIGERFTVRLDKESPGFIGNRITAVQGLYFSWVLESALERGISYGQLESAGISNEGTDVLGVDTVYYCAKYFEEYVSPDFGPSKRITDLVKAGRLGKKVGKGFYEWVDNKPLKNLEPIDKESMDFLTEILKPEIFAAIKLNEACRMLEEGVVKSYELIDHVLMKGTFIPGPFSVGKEKYKEWAKLLYEIAEKTGKPYLNPCEMMESGTFLNYK